MADWIRLDCSFVDHPKIAELEGLLGDGAGWSVVRVFCWVRRYFPGGKVPVTMKLQMERAAQWKGASGSLIDALVKVRLIDVLAPTSFYVHDWDEYQAPLIERAAKDARRQKNRRNARHAKSHADDQRDVQGTGTVRYGTERNGSPPPLEEEANARRAPPDHHQKTSASDTPTTTPPDAPNEIFETLEDFMGEVGTERMERVLPPERPGVELLLEWWAEVVQALPSAEARAVLGPAYFRFLKDPYWGKKNPPWPFQAFVTQWRDYAHVQTRTKPSGARQQAM